MKNPPAAVLPIDQLAALLGNLTEADLTAIDGRIDAKREEIEQLTRSHEAELKALKAVRDLIRKRLGVPDPRAAAWSEKAAKKREATNAAKKAAAARPAVANGAPPPSKAESLHAYRSRAAELLGKRGPLAGAVIGEECEIPPSKVAEVLRHEAFQGQVGLGYRLTEIGRRTLLEGKS